MYSSCRRSMADGCTFFILCNLLAEVHQGDLGRKKSCQFPVAWTIVDSSFLRSRRPIIAHSVRKLKQKKVNFKHQWTIVIAFVVYISHTPIMHDCVQKHCFIGLFCIESNHSMKKMFLNQQSGYLTFICREYKHRQSSFVSPYIWSTCHQMFCH